MKKKMSPHIIAAGAFVVFIVLGLACASTESTHEEPPEEPLGVISQAEMRLDDPRMPLDRFKKDGNIQYFWLGSLDSKLPVNRQSFFMITDYVNYLRIDGFRISTSEKNSYLILAPGKHTIIVSYYEIIKKGEVYHYGEYKGNVVIDFEKVKMEINMEPGKIYSIHGEETETTNYGELLGTGTRRFTTSLKIQERTFEPYTPPDWEKAYNRIYLEPYDSSVPVDKQAFLDTIDGIYILKFDNEQVFWGWIKGYRVTIGIPEGKHELQFVHKDILFSVTIDCIPGHRYKLYKGQRQEEVKAGEFTGNDATSEYTKSYEVTRITPFTKNITVLANNINSSYPIRKLSYPLDASLLGTWCDKDKMSYTFSDDKIIAIDRNGEGFIIQIDKCEKFINNGKKSFDYLKAFQITGKIIEMESSSWTIGKKGSSYTLIIYLNKDGNRIGFDRNFNYVKQ